jgi:hypothetical protein
MWPIPNTPYNHSIPQNPYQAYSTYTQPIPYILTTYPYYQQPSSSGQQNWPRQQIDWLEPNYTTQYPPQTQPPLNHQINYGQTENHFAQAFSKGIKLEFPKFNGDNPMGWLRQAEKCFTLEETLEYKKVKFAEVFLVGKADHWLCSTSINTNNLSWHEFSTLITSRFAAETSLELIDTFRHMEQSGSLSSYIDTFEEIMRKLKVQNPALPYEYFVGCFIYGLKDYIKVPLRSHNLATLVQAYALARNYESYQHKKPNFDTLRGGYRYSYQQRQTATPVRKEDTDNKQILVSK